MSFLSLLMGFDPGDGRNLAEVIPESKPVAAERMPGCRASMCEFEAHLHSGELTRNLTGPC